MTEEKKLKWTDLKIGDVIRWKDGTIERMVVNIDRRSESDSHIGVCDLWIVDDDLEYWEKVE